MYVPLRHNRASSVYFSALSTQQAAEANIGFPDIALASDSDPFLQKKSHPDIALASDSDPFLQKISHPEMETHGTEQVGLSLAVVREARLLDALPKDVRGLEGPWGCGHRLGEPLLGQTGLETTSSWGILSSVATRLPAATTTHCL